VVRWRDRGAHGITLSATVQYLVSARKGWQTIAAGISGQSFSAPIALFSHATKRVRVIVGDGFSNVDSTASPSLRLPRR
jgi:hypothetical protein